MALDDQALDAPSADPHPSLRLYRWAEPTVTYGRLLSEESARRWAGAGVPVVRRPTGGGLVRHEDDVSLSLVWPRNHPAFPPCLKNIYHAIHQTIAEALILLNRKPTLFAPSGAVDGRGVCFDGPVAEDVMLDGRKAAGGALRVTALARLYQGNIKTSAFELAPDALEEALAEAFERKFFQCPPLANPSLTVD